jgi:hypothetical protein
MLTMVAVCHSPLVAEAETALREAVRLSSPEEGWEGERCEGERP